MSEDLAETLELTFDKNLEKLHSELIAKNMTEKRKLLKLPAPKLGKDGGAKTVWSNFGAAAYALSRPVEHMRQFFASELSTDCNVAYETPECPKDATAKLIIRGKGRYKKSGIQKIMNSYIDSYVQCKVCGSTNSELLKEQRQYFVNCKDCLSKLCCQL